MKNLLHAMVMAVIPLSTVVIATPRVDATTVVQTVRAKPQWTETSISLVEGNTFSITAAGLWSNDTCCTPLYGPDGFSGSVGNANGFITDAKLGELIGLIAPSGLNDEGIKALGQNNPAFFRVGSELLFFRAHRTGKLYLGFNDYALPGNQPATNDNTGSVTATITLPAANPEAFAKSKNRRLAEWGVRNRLGALAAKVAIGLACTGTAPACITVFSMFAVNALVSGWQLGSIFDDPPDPDFSTVFVPREYPPTVIGAGGGLPPEVVTLANTASVNLTDLYELLEAWRITLERYNAATAAGATDAAAMQLAALESYILSASAAAVVAETSVRELATALEPIIGPITINQNDVDAALASLAQNGFGAEEQAIFNNLGLTQDNINEILNTLVAVNPADVPTDPFAAMRSAASNYAGLADLTSCIGGVCRADVTILRASVRLARQLDRDAFRINGNLKLVAGSNGINPLNEDVIVGLGEFTQTIPAGSFTRERVGFQFRGSQGGIVQMSIDDDGDILATARGVSLGAIDLSTPVLFSLRIGNDWSTTKIPFDEKGHFRQAR